MLAQMKLKNFFRELFLSLHDRRKNSSLSNNEGCVRCKKYESNSRPCKSPQFIKWKLSLDVIVTTKGNNRQH